MNYIIFTAALTAYLEIGSNQPTNAQFGPEPQGPNRISYNEPTHLNSMVLNLWTPLASSHPTPNLTTYVILAATLLYLAVSLRQCNIFAKSFCQAVNFYPIVYALNGFELPNLPSYVTKVFTLNTWFPDSRMASMAHLIGQLVIGPSPPSLQPHFLPQINTRAMIDFCLVIL
ncbi:hypothetical protein DSO57_1000011 [Entomophthora muscae]|uniref:Uncharacterized protein n=1 Tax=Entomophthora muscae TaxID=34485 RepID=A0ACC2SMC5_9FUNG|nr:hypothetical protein DSO57_1000011 [Entomophthora muscae]